MTGATLVIDALGPELQWRNAFARVLVGVLAGLIIGRLRDTLNAERSRAEARAAEAERLRDELGHRVDVLETANRCARALGSSLELDEAFGAFIRELRGLVPFERTAIVLVEGNTATTMATAGRGAGDVFPPGNSDPIEGSLLERVLDGKIVVRRDLAERDAPADEQLLALGLRSELVTPLLVGARTIGMLSLSRERPDAFSEDEVELVSLLGRLVATAVQNIRAYEAERRRVEELARLSQLRADFVSLVSHELRSPMAAVIGAARTLQDRWRMLTASQRESFLALIGDETARLAELVGDVLDTSRIEAGGLCDRFAGGDLGRPGEEGVRTGPPPPSGGRRAGLDLHAHTSRRAIGRVRVAEMTHDRQQIQQLAREYTEAWCSRDPRRVAAHYAADGTIAINGGEPAPIEGVAESFVAAFPDIEVFMDDLVVIDDIVEYHWTFTGTSAGTGKSVRITGFEEWTIGADGRIVESRGHYDQAEYDRQLREGAVVA